MSNSSHNRANSKSAVIDDESRVSEYGEKEDGGGRKLGDDAVDCGHNSSTVSNNETFDTSELNNVTGLDQDNVDRNDNQSSEDVLDQSDNNSMSEPNNDKFDAEDISAKTIPIDGDNKRSYVSAAKNLGVFESNKLWFIPTVMNEIGDEVVVFDEERVAIGTKKWELTLCGQLVGHSMSLPALRYHLRRMWNKFGFREIVDNGNGNWIFKFNSEQGMTYVVNQSPWMVNSKPLMVYKWDSDVGLKKVEPTKIPVWAKIAEIPLEAWTVEGISAISSSIGRPVIMDSMTAYVCKNGVGRTEFARVLVEIEANKGFKEVIELQYIDRNNQVKGTKNVKVNYEWKPPLCSHCQVFGHEFKGCGVRIRTEEEIASEKVETAKNLGGRKETEFVQKQGRKPNNFTNNQGYNRGVFNKFQYEDKNKHNTGPTKQQWNRKDTGMDSRDGIQEKEKFFDKDFPELNSTNAQTSNHSNWNKVKQNNEKGEKRNTEGLHKTQPQKKVVGDVSGNKYGVLENLEDEELSEKVRQTQSHNNKGKEQNSSAESEVAEVLAKKDKVHRENRMDDSEIMLQWKQKVDFLDKLVEDKRIPNVEESKLWFKTTNQLLYYKKKWEVKWKTGCPI